MSRVHSELMHSKLLIFVFKLEGTGEVKVSVNFLQLAIKCRSRTVGDDNRKSDI